MMQREAAAIAKARITEIIKKLNHNNNNAIVFVKSLIDCFFSYHNVHLYPKP